MGAIASLKAVVTAPLNMYLKLQNMHFELRAHHKKIEAFHALREIERLLANSRYQDEKCLTRHGYKVYSQNDEDGFIREIFERIGLTNKVFVEFGVGNGLENNTLTLLFEGWRGLWIDGSDRFVSMMRENFTKTLSSGRLKLVHSFITRDNINQLIAANIDEKEIDLLSIDLDGNDLHIFKSINCINPRVVVIEYNAKFHPPMLYCMAYDASHGWQQNDCFGASLKSMELLFRDRGYALVGCNLLGNNAFFVRSDLLADKFLGPFTAECHFEPARYHVCEFPSGHDASYATLETAEEFHINI